MYRWVNVDKRPLSSLPLPPCPHSIESPSRAPPVSQAPDTPTPAHALVFLRSHCLPFSRFDISLPLSLFLSSSPGRPLERTCVPPIPHRFSIFLSPILSPVSSQPRVAVAPRVLTYPHPSSRPDLPFPTLPRSTLLLAPPASFLPLPLLLLLSFTTTPSSVRYHY